MSIYENYLNYINSKEEKYFNLIAYDFKFIIFDEIKKINKLDQEDLFQEISLKIFELIKGQAFVLEDLTEYFKKIRMKEEINNKKITDCLVNFIKYPPNKIEYYKYINHENSLFEERFIMYIGSGRLKYYFRIIAKQIVRTYKIKKSKEPPIYKLNDMNKDGKEYIDTIPAKVEKVPPSVFDNDYFNDDERNFIKLFEEDGGILTQSEVGKKINRTQQTVSNRLKPIQRKLDLINKKVK